MSEEKNTKSKQTPPPSAVEVEEIVLGSILIESTVIDRIISDFSINLFFKDENATIAKAIIELYKTNIAIDLVTLVNKLKESDSIAKAGGIPYISKLTQNVAQTSNIDYHVRILQEEALRRNLIIIGGKAVQNSFDETKDIFDVFEETQSDMDNAIKSVVNYEIKNVGQIHEDIVKKSIQLLGTKQKSGVPTGLWMLDNVTNGWQSSDLIILAGRPGMGKTAVAVSMCIAPSLEFNIPVAIFSLEMSNEQLVSRLQSSLSGVNVSKIVKKQLSEEDILMIQGRAKPLSTMPIYIDDTPNISLLDLKGKCRKLKKENGIQLVVIDYLQLMRSGTKTQSREQEIAEISRGLKALAKELNVPIIALSQLSRSVEARGGDKKPMLQDLRESGQIEQDADMVLFCWRPEYYGVSEYEVGGQDFSTDGLFMLIIAKHRNGELGEIPLRFIHEQTKVTNHEFSQKYISQNSDDSKKSCTFVQQNNEFEQTGFTQLPNNVDFDTETNDEAPF